MIQYLDLLRKIRDEGVERSDRTGVGTRGIFGYQMRFNLEDGFPLVTTKKMYTKAVVHELLWFLSGSTNARDLQARGVGIWDEWADPQSGELGPVYGKQWRSWQTTDGRSVDQIKDVINQIKTNPNSRRLIVNAWNVGDVPRMAIPPCHLLYQFHVADGKLNCQLYQRSGDIFLGVPFNIASYALLTHMIAGVTGLKPGEFIHTLGDAHLYLNHLSQADLQLSREPLALPTLEIPRKESIDDYVFEDVQINGYHSHPAIKAPIAV